MIIFCILFYLHFIDLKFVGTRSEVNSYFKTKVNLNNYLIFIISFPIFSIEFICHKVCGQYKIHEYLTSC